MVRGLINAHSERDAEEVASWISQHGPSLGFRVPNVRERGRAMGWQHTLKSLGCLRENYTMHKATHLTFR
ncbi:MAG: hypothetical protein ACKPKO_00240, partial [Candidatus Fonsibacter sp.]